MPRYVTSPVSIKFRVETPDMPTESSSSTAQQEPTDWPIVVLAEGLPSSFYRCGLSFTHSNLGGSKQRTLYAISTYWQSTLHGTVTRPIRFHSETTERSVLAFPVPILISVYTMNLCRSLIHLGHSWSPLFDFVCIYVYFHSVQLSVCLRRSLLPLHRSLWSQRQSEDTAHLGDI